MKHFPLFCTTDFALATPCIVDNIKENQHKRYDIECNRWPFSLLRIPLRYQHQHDTTKKAQQQRWEEVTHIHKQVLTKTAQYSCARCGHALGMPNTVYERRRRGRHQFGAAWTPPHAVAKRMSTAASRCSVPKCTTTTRNSVVSFFRFPKSVTRQVMGPYFCCIVAESFGYSATEWALALDRKDLLDKVGRLHNSSYRVCGMHFRREMFASDLRNRLSKHAVPMLIPPTEQSAAHHPTTPVLTTTIFLIQQAPPNNKGNLRLCCFNLTIIYFLQV